MTEKVLDCVGDHRLRRPQRGRDGDGARAAQPVQARRRALPPHRGALGQGAVRQGVGGVRRPGARRNWDRASASGEKKIFEVRALYNDVTFIDEFLTEEFCREHKFFTFGCNERTGNYEIETPRVQEGEGEAAVPAHQRGQAVHLRRGRATTRTAASCCSAQARGHRPARATTRATRWRRWRACGSGPVNLLTRRRRQGQDAALRRARPRRRALAKSGP